MSNSNWRGGNNRNEVHNGNLFYGIDNVGLQQLGAGLPLQMLGLGGGSLGPAPLHQGRQGLCTSGPSGETRISNGGWPFNNQCESRDSEIEKTIDGIPIRKLYITNIAPDVTYFNVCELFNRYGSVYHVYLRTPQNGRSNGKQFAFVTYTSPKDASRVLKFGKVQDYRRRVMFVSAADSWHQPKEGPHGEIIMPSKFPEKTPKENADETISEEEDSGAVASLVEVAQMEGGLNSLNDDCMLHIFSFLNYKQISGVERVCKRWQGLSYRMWKCMRELDFTKEPFNETKMTTPILQQHLKRCGEFLNLLKLTGKGNAYSEAAIAIVAKYCVNLEVLRVESIYLGSRSLAHLGRCCTKLKCLTIYRCAKYNDSDLISLLPRCQQLSELCLHHNHDIDGRFLTYIQSPITVLKLDKCISIKVEYLLAGAARMSETLKSLSLVDCTNDKVNQLLHSLPNLTSLCLDHPCFSSPIEPLMSLGYLKKLTCLDLTRNSLIDNKVIMNIIENCEELSCLKICCVSPFNSSITLTEDAVSMLGRIRKLVHLDLSYLEVTTDSVLKTIIGRNSRLKELVCRGCTEITDEGCSQVVSMCNDLELFDLSGSGVGEPTVLAALTSVKMRTNNTHLRLIMGGTRFQSGELPEGTEPSKLLTLDMSNLCNDLLMAENMMYYQSEFLSDEEVVFDNLCCDCDLGFHDLCDPTLLPSDFEDEILQFQGYDDHYDLDGWTDDDYDDDDEFFAPQEMCKD